MGVDMGAMGNMTMVPFMHFQAGSPIWFLEWMPTTTGAVVGASIGLFLLAIVERWLSAMRIVMEAWWRRRAESILAARFTPVPEESTAEKGCSGLDDGTTPSLRRSQSPRALPSLRVSPFIWSHDLSRGVMQAAQTALLFSLMLAIMTYNGAYFIAIVVGSGVGEVLFGRFGRGRGAIIH